MVPAKLHATKNTLGLVFSLYNSDAINDVVLGYNLTGDSLFAPVTEVGNCVNCNYGRSFSLCMFLLKNVLMSPL